MSKSSGNGIDPILLIDKYGSDALRFALIREVAGAGQDIRLDFDRKKDTSSTVEASRNFANKLWNATKFVLIHSSIFFLNTPIHNLCLNLIIKFLKKEEKFS